MQDFPADLRFISAHPIGNTDVNALPVKEIGPAVAYYQNVLGFQCTERSATHAKLTNGTAEIGLAVNGHDPEQASIYIEVPDPSALRAFFESQGSEPSPLRIDQHGGNTYEIFFDKEPYGVCFCFGKRIS